MSLKKPTFKPGQSGKKAASASKPTTPSSVKGKSLAQQIAELTSATPKDFDPEDEDASGFAEAARVDDYDAMEDDGPKLISERSHIRKNFDVDDISAEYRGKVVNRKSLQAFGDESEDEEEGEDEDEDEEDGEDGEEEDGEDEEEDEDEEDEDEENEDQDDDEDDDGEGGTKAMLASGLSDQQKRVQQQLALLEAEDEDVGASLFQPRGDAAGPVASASATSQYTKSVHMQNQQAWYSSMLNLRIRVQGVVAAANRLPPSADVAVVEEVPATGSSSEPVAARAIRSHFESASGEVAPAYASAMRGARKLLDELFELQHELMAQNTRIFASAGGDAAAGADEEADPEEDAEAARARIPRWEGPTATGGKKRKRSEVDSGDEETEAADASDDDDTSDALVDEYWSYLSGQLTPYFRPVQDALIDKWNTKTQLSAGMVGGVQGGGSAFGSSGLKSAGAGAGGLRAINQSVLSQIDQLMLDQARLVKRSQLHRAGDGSDGPGLLGRVATERARAAKKARGTDDDDEEDPSLLLSGRYAEHYDPNIYDDNDYYQQLLGEIISAASGSTGEGGSAAVGHDAAILAKAAAAARKKNKRGGGMVDRRASKGRKLRYTVHAKLANFMAPRAAPIADDYAARASSASNSSSLLTGSGFAMDELFMNLFGGQGKKTLLAAQQQAKEARKATA